MCADCHEKHESGVTLKLAFLTPLSLFSKARKSNFHKRKSSFLQKELFAYLFPVLAPAGATEKNRQKKKKKIKNKERGKVENKKGKKEKQKGKTYEKKQSKRKRTSLFLTKK